MSALPILDLSATADTNRRPELLAQLRASLFDIGFLYISNHGVPEPVISHLTAFLPRLFDLSEASKAALSKLNSPHFLGYSGFAEETTRGERDLREQFDFATELPLVWTGGDVGAAKGGGEAYSQLFWRLRGPNQWPEESELPGFRAALTDYHDALAALSYCFVHLVEEAFSIPVGTFDNFFRPAPQHRIKLVKYPPITPSITSSTSLGVGPHADTSGWLTFLLQPSPHNSLEVLSPQTGEWIPAPPVPGTFVVNFGHAFEAATAGAVRATVHRVRAPEQPAEPRYSVPFFMGLPLGARVSNVREWIPRHVLEMRKDREEPEEDPRWEVLGEAQLRKWIRSHVDVAKKWYGSDAVAYYSQ
ncbi:Clavaminate synthase-like protein [Trichodelitschia bisporula]|uniref:Clavaminate synthase-like protein n=1 Tax=Trichodelitschia bisporula TaxID=703511 RepID=A0A6G1HS61_9PEZI|nr:Clavaminate synthase-like protein [Trichodelitschia bisporula]